MLAGFGAPTLSQTSPQDIIESCPTPLLEGGCFTINARTVFAYTGDVRRIHWTVHPSDLFRRDRMRYIAEIRTIPGDSVVDLRLTGEAEEEIYWTPTRSGLYYVRARACDPHRDGDPDDIEIEEECSEWAVSLENADGTPGWMLHIAVKAPSGGGIE